MSITADRLKQVKEYAKLLRKASVWHNTKTTISHIESQKIVKKQNEYVYEFYCYLRVVQDLLLNYDIEYRSGVGKFKDKFPQAPATKKGKPYFVLKDKNTNNVIYHVCAGIKIELPHSPGKFAAPDISITKHYTPEDNHPQSKDIELIHDAKYNHEDSDKDSVARAQFYYVSGIITDLEIKDGRTPTVVFTKLNGFNSNCLITNNDAYVKTKAGHLPHGFKEVESFDIGKKHIVIG